MLFKCEAELWALGVLVSSLSFVMRRASFELIVRDALGKLLACTMCLRYAISSSLRVFVLLG